MKQTIRNIINFINKNKGQSFINVYPYFGIIDNEGVIKDYIVIDDDYCYYFDKETNRLYVENYETGKTRIFKVQK